MSQSYRGFVAAFGLAIIFLVIGLYDKGQREQHNPPHATQRPTITATNAPMWRAEYEKPCENTANDTGDGVCEQKRANLIAINGLWWNRFASFLTAIGLLFIWCSLGHSRKSADAAKVAAEIARQELIATHRPRLIVRSASLELGTRGPCEVSLRISNIGESRAAIIRHKFQIFFEEFPSVQAENLMRSSLAGGWMGLEGGHAQGIRMQMQVDRRRLNAERRKAGTDKPANIYLWGMIAYEDGNGILRNTGIFRRLDVKTNRFIACESDHEHCD